MLDVDRDDALLDSLQAGRLKELTEMAAPRAGESRLVLDVRVELVLPSCAPWTAGPADAVDRVAGSAEDFCLVVTQRRNVADTALAVTGPAASAWLAVAQAFAGGATLPPPPRHAKG